MAEPHCRAFTAQFQPRSTADHSHHIAVGGIHDGQGDLQLILHLLTGGVGIAAGIGDILQIIAHILRDLLILGILGGVDLVALAVDHVDGLVVGGDLLALAVLNFKLCHLSVLLGMTLG